MFAIDSAVANCYYQNYCTAIDCISAAVQIQCQNIHQQPVQGLMNLNLAVAVLANLSGNCLLRSGVGLYTKKREEKVARPLPGPFLKRHGFACFGSNISIRERISVFAFVLLLCLLLNEMKVRCCWRMCSLSRMMCHLNDGNDEHRSKNVHTCSPFPFLIARLDNGKVKHSCTPVTMVRGFVMIEL